MVEQKSDISRQHRLLLQYDQCIELSKKNQSLGNIEMFRFWDGRAQSIRQELIATGKIIEIFDEVTQANLDLEANLKWER